MVVGYRRLDADRQQVALAQLNAIAVEYRWKQDIDFPVEPFAHELARRGGDALKSSERLRQVLDDGCRLNTDAAVIDQNRNLPPAGQRLKLRGLVGTFLEAHVPERERLARHMQHESHFIGRE